MLNKPDASGTTKREHLEQVERQTGLWIKDLEPPTDFPSVLAGVWSAFTSLNRRRSQGFNGPALLEPSTIKDWMEITGNRLDHRDIETIFILDERFMEVYNRN